ncbi:MAG: endo alpha-1,4 polygalactosaminidase [Galactobacter sp.]
MKLGPVRARWLSSIAFVCLAGVVACSSPGPLSEPEAGHPSAGGDDIPGDALPSDVTFDYQLGGAYPPPRGADVVVRDRTEEPLRTGYSICYVNAFQTQPGDAETPDQKLWEADLLLTKGGEPVADPEWPDEFLLDTSTERQRERIAEIVSGWIHGCSADGFQAVEFDNLDSYTRSGGALTLEDNTALASILTEVAHRDGLAVAQKNLAEHASTLKDAAGFDLAVAEECGANEECGEYTAAYGDQVLDIEYTDNLPSAFEDLCGQEGAPKSMILRDRDLVTPEDDGYVYRTCP